MVNENPLFKGHRIFIKDKIKSQSMKVQLQCSRPYKMSDRQESIDG